MGKKVEKPSENQCLSEQKILKCSTPLNDLSTMRDDTITIVDYPPQYRFLRMKEKVREVMKIHDEKEIEHIATAVLRFSNACAEYEDETGERIDLYLPLLKPEDGFDVCGNNLPFHNQANYPGKTIANSFRLCTLKFALTVVSLFSLIALLVYNVVSNLVSTSEFWEWAERNQRCQRSTNFNCHNEIMHWITAIFNDSNCLLEISNKIYSTYNLTKQI